MNGMRTTNRKEMRCDEGTSDEDGNQTDTQRADGTNAVK
jgi:hypothetical protein